MEEFMVLRAVVILCEREGRLVPTGCTVSQVKEFLYEDGWAEWESPQITAQLTKMQRRRLVTSRRPPPQKAGHLRVVEPNRGRRWLPTLYGSNVATA